MNKLLTILLSIIFFQSQAFGQLGFVGLIPIINISGHYGKSEANNKWVNQQTTLTGSESVNITVGGDTKVKGAVIANADMTYDEDGKIILGEDKKNFTLNTKSFEYEDIEDVNQQRSYSYGTSISVGGYDKKGNILTSSLGNTQSLTTTIRNSGHKKEQLTRATLGQGKIIVDGKEQTGKELQGLNRDINKSQEITYDKTTRQLDGETTVDVRFWKSVYSSLNKGDINELSLVQDTKEIYAGGKAFFETIKNIFGEKVSTKELQGFLDRVGYLMSKEDNELLESEREEKQQLIEKIYQAYFDNLTTEEQENIRNDKDLRKLINKKRKAVEKFYEDLSKFVANRTRDINYALDKGYPACNLYAYYELANKYELILPMNKKYTMTANQMYDYFINSTDYETIPKVNNNLDHETARRLAKEGYIVMAVFKNETGGHGHIAIVTGGIFKNTNTKETETEIAGYNSREDRNDGSNKTGKIMESDAFSKQFARESVLKNTDFIYYKIKPVQIGITEVK